MSNPTELEKSEHEVRDLEYRSKGVKDKIDFLDKEIILLCLKEITLQDNIKNLKKNSVIVLAAEFRRSKEDLTKTKARLEIIRKEKTDLDKALIQILIYLGKSRLKLYKLLKSREDNILQGNFGGSHD